MIVFLFFNIGINTSHQNIFTFTYVKLNLIIRLRRHENVISNWADAENADASGLSFIWSHCNGPLHGVLCFNVRHSRRSLPRGDAAGAVCLSRGRKLEIFISNAACKVREAPPLQVIFMRPPRSNELIFTFYAFILVCPRRAPSVPPVSPDDWVEKRRSK